MYLTHKAKIHPDSETEQILNNLCFSATKVYNTVLYNLRKPYEGFLKMRDYCFDIDYPFDLEPPKTSLNRIALQTEYKSNHWAKNLHSQSTQYVIKEVIDSYKSFFALRQNGHTDASLLACGQHGRLTGLIRRANTQMDRDTTANAPTVGFTWFHRSRLCNASQD